MFQNDTSPQSGRGQRTFHPELCLTAFAKILDFEQNVPIRAGSQTETSYSLNTLFPRPLKRAFTLAEVLITLGIIGIVAAMTLPGLIQNYQQAIINQQFKRAYSQLSNALVMVEHELGYKPACNEGGDGLWSSECYKLRDVLYKEILPVVKSCEGNALRNGCLPKESYKGLDTIHMDKNPDESEEDKNAYLDFLNSNCSRFTKSYIENQNYVYVMNDGTIYMLYGTLPSILSIDVNGKKKPNKWGYDIFTFYLRSDVKKPIYIPYVDGGCTPIEPGGKSAQAMFDEIY